MSPKCLIKAEEFTTAVEWEVTYVVMGYLVHVLQLQKGVV